MFGHAKLLCGAGGQHSRDRGSDHFVETKPPIVRQDWKIGPTILFSERSRRPFLDFAGLKATERFRGAHKFRPPLWRVRVPETRLARGGSLERRRANQEGNQACRLG